MGKNYKRKRARLYLPTWEFIASANGWSKQKINDERIKRNKEENENGKTNKKIY